MLRASRRRWSISRSVACSAAFSALDPLGPLELIQVSGAVQGDDTFAVPGATGYGPSDSLDAAVNAVAGVPSPSGSNHLALDDATSSLLAPVAGQNGQTFANQWHIAFG